MRFLLPVFHAAPFVGLPKTRGFLSFPCRTLDHPVPFHLVVGLLRWLYHCHPEQHRRRRTAGLELLYPNLGPWIDNHPANGVVPAETLSGLA